MTPLNHYLSSLTPEGKSLLVSNQKLTTEQLEDLFLDLITYFNGVWYDGVYDNSIVSLFKTLSGVDNIKPLFSL